MAKLLYIESSPRKERSHSIAVAHAFLAAYRAAHLEDAVDLWDLWAPDEQLMEFDGAAITAKYAALGPTPNHSPAEAEAWASIGRTVDRLKAADKYLFGVPTWNFGIPYKLKHMIDVATQPGLTFWRDPVKGPQGLLTGRKAVVVSARGGIYAPGTPHAPSDMEHPYVERWLNFIGITDITSFIIEGTGQGEPQAAEARSRATAEAQVIAASF